MTDTAVVSRESKGSNIALILEHYTAAAITTGTEKKEWVCPIYGRIVDVIVDSETAGSGGTSDIIDVNIGGTTIYTTQGNRPTLLLANTGLWAEAAEPEVQNLSPGDIVSYDIDQICTTGSARVKVTILIARR
jgi:hypothetical protein